MKLYISKLYIWFDKGVKPRIITFENNKVNVITGSSSTGKSNIYAIIDYCLLSGRSNIVFPVINENACWYGMEFQIGDKFFAIARKKPTVDVVPPELWLQHEPFAEHFYPTVNNSHVNGARRELNKAFGYKSDKEIFYRSCFVFNALTENILTSPYDFLNFKFYGIEMFENKEERCNFVESVLTPDVEQFRKINEELKDLQKKKKKFDNYKRRLEKKTDGFNELLVELVNMCIDAQLLKENVKDSSDEDQIAALKGILEENMIPKEKMDECDKEFKSLQEKHSQISLQLANISRAKNEQKEYIKSLGLVEDSLKPVEVLYEKINDQGANMWTSHVVGSLKSSLAKISSNKHQAEVLPIVSEQTIQSLSDQLKLIEDRMEMITKQKGSLYQQVNNLRLIGFLESKVEELTQLWQTKQKEESEEIEIFAEEDVQRISVLEKAKGEIEQKQLNIISELNKCIQHIFNGFNYMEHYEHCYTKYVIKQECLMLNDGKSIFNYDTIGSQSNYMFLHLCFFLGIHRYFFENLNVRHIGQFLFIDQPSIPYYAGSENVKTTDKEKLLDAFASINSFMKYVIEEKKEQFQIILVEHAPETYWTGENNLDYFVTRETFTSGNALIPKYVLEKKEDNEN